MVQTVSYQPLNKEVRVGKTAIIMSDFLRVLPLTSPNDATKLQHILNEYEQYTGAQFNFR